MQQLPVVVDQHVDGETAATGVVDVAQHGQLVSPHRDADILRRNPVVVVGILARVEANPEERLHRPGGGS